MKLLISELNKLNLKVNVDKTKFQYFPIKRHHKTLNINITNSTQINIVDEYKYLGVIIDKKLNFCSHTNKLKNDIAKRLQIIKYIANKKSGGHPITLLNLCKAIIFPKMFYGSSIYAGGIRQNMNYLQSNNQIGHGICKVHTKSRDICRNGFTSSKKKN